MTGKEMVTAWKQWLESDEGKRCLKDSASGKYLENRLNYAFFAGIHAAQEAGKDA